MSVSRQISNQNTYKHVTLQAMYLIFTLFKYKPRQDRYDPGTTPSLDELSVDDCSH